MSPEKRQNCPVILQKQVPHFFEPLSVVLAEIFFSFSIHLMTNLLLFRNRLLAGAEQVLAG